MSLNHYSSPSRVVFLTGAGLSADSGVPTFRGEAGFYEGVRAEELISDRTMRRNPEVIQKFMDNMRMKMRDVKPNKAHEMIARLGREFGDRISHLTQNLDPLVGVAGYSDTIHLHGYLTRMRSIGNSKVVEDIGFTRYWGGDVSEAPPRGFKFRCLKTGSYMRPDVVLFGEMAPEYAKLHRVLRRMRRQDTLIVIGTQGNVLPIQHYAMMTPAVTVLNNLHSSADINEEYFDYLFMDRAASVADDIEGLARQRLREE